MKLALLVEYYPPSRTSAAVQMSDLARSFVRHGHDVTVFTASPEVADSCVKDEAAALRVVRVPTSKVKGISLSRRALSEIFMSFNLWRGARRCGIRMEEFDGIIWYSPTIFLAPFVAWLKHKSRAPAYLILRDLFPQWAVDAGVMRKGLAYYFFKGFERFQYSTADVIGVQSPANLYYFRTGGRSSYNLEVLYNWIELGRPEPDCVASLEKHSIAASRVLVYGGNMGIAQDIDNLLRLAENIRHENDIALLLIGAGTEVTRLRRELSERRLVNVVVAPEVEPEEFRSVLRKCDAGLITLDRRLTTHNIPGKLLAYLEAGLPVIASVNPGNDLIAMLEKSGAGLGFINGDDQAFAQAAVSVVTDAALCLTMAEKARALASSTFSVDSITRQLVSALSPTTPEAGRPATGIPERGK